MAQRLYTPYGFRDILFDESWQQTEIRHRLRKVFRAFGYRDVETPLVEYLEVFSDERGSIPTQDMYKFVDRDGELLALRPDMTPALARMASFYYRDEDLPLRVTSSGPTFRYSSRYSAKQRQLKQTGIELYGTADPLMDAEVVATSIQALQASGVSEFRTAIGHADLVQGLLKAFDLSEEEIQEWSRQIESKNTFALEQEAREKGLSEEQTAMLLLLTESGDVDLLRRGKELAEKLRLKQMLDAFEWLLETDRLLGLYHVAEYVLYDPGMKPELNYYTGIIFKGYALGAAEPVLDGGRYDALLRQMGAEWGAVGSAIYQDCLLEALKHQDLLPEPFVCTLLTGPDPELLIRRAETMRAEGKAVVCVPGLSADEARVYAEKHCDSRVLIITEEGQETV
ncbi:MAG: ATP phosphoribosyltransferase regulatory subunit [Clostridiales bacterium]|nr:ATP phosphoribosyltransferase regulatory subunit [Clostridiales bacterium]